MVRHVVVTKIDWDNPINTTPPERNLGLVVDHAQSSMCINKYVYIYIYTCTFIGGVILEGWDE